LYVIDKNAYGGCGLEEKLGIRASNGDRQSISHSSVSQKVYEALRGLQNVSLLLSQKDDSVVTRNREGSVAGKT
jgi:hypothetical protein